MALPDVFLPTTCDVHRPFGAASPTHSNIPCRLVADYSRSRHSSLTPAWTHYLLLNSSADIRDGVARPVGSNSLTYADGDEVRIRAGASTPRFVVVWVEVTETGTPQEHKRVFLLRHTA
jgi:hypothetical protein